MDRLTNRFGRRHRSQDEEETYFNVIFDERTFTMEIYGEVSEEMVEKFRLFFNNLAKLYTSKPASKKPKWITITIDSAGGLSSQGLAMYDTIKTSGVPVKTVALGYVESSAFIFFLAGSTRCVHEHSVLMTHLNWQENPGGPLTHQEFSIPAKQLKVLEGLYQKIILENSRLSRTELKKLQEQEKLITAEEAVKYGLAHEIIKNS